MSDSASSHHPTRRPPSPGFSEGSTRTVQGGQEPVVPTAETQPTVISRRPPIPMLPQGSASGSAKAEPVDANGIAPGTRLGDIELGEYIGGGGMGRVYRGQDTRLGRTVAVKVLGRDQVADQEAVRRFLNEARSVARLNHQHIAQVYFAGESDGLPYIVFEFVEGTNIRRLVDKKGPLPLAEALSYTLQIADAVSHAAEHHVVHRDIKPSNVLIEAHGKAKLIDLGLARINEPDSTETDLTASGVTLGTFDYISPEQARDPRNADIRSDTYSLGCTFFYMLAGRPPFPEGTVLQKLLQHQGDEPPDVCQFRPDLPEEVGRVLGKMMAKDPQRRYQSAARLIEALLSLADLIGLRPTGPGYTVWLPPRPTTVSTVQRHLPWLAPVVAMGAMLLALNFFWSGRESPGWVSTGAPAVSAKPAGGSRPSSAQVERPGPSSAQPPVAAGGAAGQPAPNPAPATVAGHGQPEAPSAADVAAGPSTPSPHAAGAAATADSLIEKLLRRPSPVAGLSGQPLVAELAVAERGPWGLSVGRAGVGRAVGLGPPGPRAESADPLAENSAPRQSTLVVVPVPDGPQQFSSLTAALEARPPAAVVELRFNGRREAKPIRLTNRKVTLRAGEGFQPVIVFRPREIDPVIYPREMIALEGSELVVEGTALELDVPQDLPSESWSLVAAGGAARLELVDSSLTIRNAAAGQSAYHRQVAFVRVKSPLEASLAADSEAASPAPPLELRIKDSIVRGEAVMLRVESDRTVRLDWNNGLLATSEHFLVVEAGARPPVASREDLFQLTHVTAVGGEGFCRFEFNPRRPHVCPARFELASNVIATGDRPLVTLSGALGTEKSLDRISWKGRKNLGSSGAEAVAIVVPEGAEEPGPSADLIDQWKQRADELPSPEALPWLNAPGGDRPYHARTPKDYLLDPAAFSSSGSTGDDAGQTPGMLAGRMPPLPPEPSASTVATP